MDLKTPEALTPGTQVGLAPSPNNGAFELFIRKSPKTKFMPRPEHSGGEVRRGPHPGPLTQFPFPSGGGSIVLEAGSPISPTHSLPASWLRGNRDFWLAADAGLFFPFPFYTFFKDVKNNINNRQLLS